MNHQTSFLEYVFVDSYHMQEKGRVITPLLKSL